MADGRRVRCQTRAERAAERLAAGWRIVPTPTGERLCLQCGETFTVYPSTPQPQRNSQRCSRCWPAVRHLYEPAVESCR